jgi:hypothetical protein
MSSLAISLRGSLMLAVIEILVALIVISVLVTLTMFLWLWAWDLFKALMQGQKKHD